MQTAQIIRPNFTQAFNERTRIAAGLAAYIRAKELGFERHACEALRRHAKDKWIVGEHPQVTALRTVARPEDSATVPRGPAPKGAA